MTIIPVPFHAFVDETKALGLTMAMTVVDSRHVAECRRLLRGQLLHHKRRLHFQQEQDRRRRQLAGVISTLPATVRLYRAPDARRTPGGER